MSDNTEQNSPLNEENPEKSEQTDDSKDEPESKQKSAFEELIKKISESDRNKNISELLQGLGAANVYIDARSGGAYFANQVDITGDVVGNTQHKWSAVSDQHSSAEGVAGQVLSVEIEKVSSVYVQTTRYTQAQQILNEKHLLILWGNSRLGKRTTAIHLLLSCLHGEDIFEIDPTVDKLSSLQCESKQMYVIDTLAPDSASKLSNYVLRGLSQKLTQKDSYLIITIDSSWRISQEALGDYLINWSELPKNETVLETHLVWYLKTTEAVIISDTLNQPDIDEILNNKLLPDDIDRLAELLAKVLKNELKLEEALAGFRVRVQQKVESWFDEHEDPRLRIFMISLAVFSGSKYQTVINASQDLQSILRPQIENGQTYDSEPLFNKKRSQWLQYVSAHVVQGYENTEFGNSAVELIELDNPAFQPAVLYYVWHEYDQYRERLLKWLHELGSHRDFQVRIRVAAAVGELSKYAFGDVLDQVLRHWANCDDERLQRLAAISLSIPVFESKIAPQVLSLLHHWSKDKNNYKLRWTAAAAYGGYVGLRFPDIALRDLFVIAQVVDGHIFSAVAESVVTLFEAGKFLPSQYFTVLNALQLWTEQANTKKVKELVSLIIWILIYEPKAPKESNKAHFPALLWLLWQEKECLKADPTINQVYEGIVTYLLCYGLNVKLTRKLLLEEIHKWLKLVDYDPQLLYPVVGPIIFTLATEGTELERERILSKLKQWASVGQPNAASKILLKIKKHLNA